MKGASRRDAGPPLSFDTLRELAGEEPTGRRLPPPADAGPAPAGTVADPEAASVRLEIVLTHLAFRLRHERGCPVADRALAAWFPPRGLPNRGLFSRGGPALLDDARSTPDPRLSN